MCFHLGTGPLRVGVGDVPAAPSTSGSGDVEDWALFAPLSGNGAGDFSGSNTWCFGGEFRANDGYNGEVRIVGLQAAAAVRKDVWLLLDLGAERSVTHVRVANAPGADRARPGC